MGQTYAGVLGPLAFATTLARGILAGHGLEPTMLAASIALFAFAALGFVTGKLADYLVGESVRWQFSEAMQVWQRKHAEKSASVPK
jgi:hypothetical protein